MAIGRASTVGMGSQAAAEAGGYFSCDDIIPISAAGASEHLLGQLLSGVYDAVLANCPTATGPEVEAAQQLVRSIRLRGGGFTLSAYGVGIGGSQSESVATPPGALLLDGPRVLRNLLGYALSQGAQGIVLHLNNLEKLSARCQLRRRARLSNRRRTPGTAGLAQLPGQPIQLPLQLQPHADHHRVSRETPCATA